LLQIKFQRIFKGAATPHTVAMVRSARGELLETVRLTSVTDALLIQSGIKGLIFLGSLGENQPMSGEEKRRVIEAMVKV